MISCHPWPLSGSEYVGYYPLPINLQFDIVRLMNLVDRPAKENQKSALEAKTPKLDASCIKRSITYTSSPGPSPSTLLATVQNDPFHKW